ncbi:exo-beta-N-acetylmuramidase NamZ family protein [Marinilabilia rubra]|uniref:DUF1343 domain-containing protein n=1 Tax=Marinilabilia rubra TaxID=2162893 RepID=A0A2U2BCU1_9BACT|nr:DUF1343 domain-containing protein [Marinilabilia rubra]PWE00880.1 DUF1343 domain-containing protein [Marinilabilia rubra]
MKLIISTLIFVQLFTACIGCIGQTPTQLKTGAERTEKWLSLLSGKSVGLLVNQTSLIGRVHLVDSILSHGIDVKRIFAPEHGFRGNADAGEHVKDGIDETTKIPVISLYGESRKPNDKYLKDLDVVVFDVQDVGVRFYTYISSMHYMMEACARNGVEFIVLDRPNPNGDYFDGPVLEPEFRSFVGMHPIPVVHGLTVGELAKMINGEGWLENNLTCDLTVVGMDGYTHSIFYELPVKPSPNLPNMLSIRLYPSLCFFEASKMSVGRGTMFPFQVVGAPDSIYGDFTFTPGSIDGMAKHPKYEGEVCYGRDYRGLEPMKQEFSLEPLMHFYRLSPDKTGFISRREWFNLLSGNDRLIKKIEKGWSEEKIRKSWNSSLKKYGLLREKYLLYP